MTAFENAARVMARKALPRAKQWADASLFALQDMTPDERRLWLATKPAGEQWFNYRRLKWVLTQLPSYREKFEQYGIRP